MNVAIVGAGPAGTWAARALAKHGARVRLFDPSHPREKPCGGGVTGRALALVSAAVDIEALAAIAVTDARFAGGVTDDPVRIELPAHGASPRSALVVVSRAVFDRALLDAAVRAGATHVPTRVRDVRVDASGAHLQIGDDWTRADVVIGADGANSLVRRRLSRAFNRTDLSIAAGYFVHGARSTTIDIAFTADPAGYFWSFPRHDHLAVGACAQADATTADAMRQLAHGWLRRSGLDAQARLERYAWPIPSLLASTWADDAAPLAGPRWLLVGDAAGLVDPITREGIYFALQSGAQAADALAAAGDATARYRLALAETILPELVHAARLKAGFFSARFLALAMDALVESDRIRNVMADLIAGCQPYRTLRTRLLRTFELGLAWKLLRARREVRRHLVQ
jgi:geranylgeranyl reductase family protein